MSEAEDPLRSCGGCTACCYTHAVGEIRKYEFSDCPDCTSAGCAIYESRPRACGAYFCLWALQGVGNDTERPDKIGVVCNTLYTRFSDDDPPSILMLEARTDALTEMGAQSLLARVLASGTSVRTGSRDSSPRYAYHVSRRSMKAYGELLQGKNLKVVWHE